MRKYLVLCVVVVIVASLFYFFRPYGGAVTSRSLLDFFDNIDIGEITGEDLAEQRYYTMVDEKGREILVTGRKIFVGDEYITGDNKLYRVYRVRQRVAYARFIREVGAFFDEGDTGLSVMLRSFFGGTSPVQGRQERAQRERDVRERQERERQQRERQQRERQERERQQRERQQRERQERERPEKERPEKERPKREPEENLQPRDEPKQLIAIYHSHNDESYIPSDGTYTIDGPGGIHKVGATLTSVLEEKGITVKHDETLHLPHDRGAYRRSRPTAQKLIEDGPDAVYDVHRDAAPPRAYAAKVEGERITQVMFVIGRQNPNMRVTRQYALDLKKTADELHPNLVKGIFMGAGNYNQDLTPLSLLLEVGAHQNSREEAERGITLFADVISTYFYGTPEGPAEAADPPAEEPGPGPGGLFRIGPGDAPGDGPGGQIVRRIAPQLGLDQPARANRIAFRNMFWLLAVTAVAAVAFFLLNTGGADEIRFRLMPYFEKIRPYTEKGDRFLEPWQERIHTSSVAAWQVIHPALLEGDRVLGGWQEQIYAATVVAWDKTRVALQEGDRVLAGWQEQIQAASVAAWDKTQPLLEEGDRYLALWQEKIREWSLTVKEKALELYARIQGRDKLR